jgi:hypothetical protein
MLSYLSARNPRPLSRAVSNDLCNLDQMLSFMPRFSAISLVVSLSDSSIGNRHPLTIPPSPQSHCLGYRAVLFY